jgi:thioredoxin-like negative regulator of GroEL
VPDFADDEDEAPLSPTRAMQDALIEQVNDLLEDEWEWDAAAEKAHEALAIDPTYGRAANALLRCYLTHNALREMQHALIKLFNPGDERFNQRHRIAAYSYRVLSRADFWLEWYEELPPEFSDLKDVIAAGEKALRHAYFGGEDRDLQEARAQFKAALDRAADRAGLLWYVARLYADKGYFADSAALLSSLIAAVPNHTHALRLYAEMIWWRDHSWQIPWIH